MAEIDLDMELLAAVSGPRDSAGGGGEGDSDSSDELEEGDGDGDDTEYGRRRRQGGDGGDDDNGDDSNDMEVDDDDDDDDDDDYSSGLSRRRHPDDPGLDDGDDADDDDDNDDDYGTSGAKKKASAKGRAKGAAAGKRGKSGKAREKTDKQKGLQKRKRPTKSKSDVRKDGDDDPEVFTYMYDEQGYGDAEDRAKVEAMNEIDRETLLAERVEERQRQERMWMMTRQMQKGSAKKMARSSGRAKPVKAKADAALEALHSDKLAKKSSAQKRALADVSDDESIEDGEARKRPRTDGREGESGVEDGEEVQDDLYRDMGEGLPLQYDDLVVQGQQGPGEDIARVLLPKHLLLPRDQLCELMKKPYFERAVKGLFVRYRKNFRNHASMYFVCTIDSVETLPKVYQIRDASQEIIRSNKYLTLRIGDDVESKISVDLCSNSVPTEAEFKTYLSRLEEQGKRPLPRPEVDKLLNHALAMTRSSVQVTATEAETKDHIANQMFLYPETVNWTEKKGEVSMEAMQRREEYQAALDGGDPEAVKKAKEKLDAVEKRLASIEARIGGPGTNRSMQIFQSAARRNEALNSANERLAASRRAMETTSGGVNPFARFDTTGMSYFSIKSKAKTEDVAIASGDEKARVANGSGVEPGGVGSGDTARSGADDWLRTLKTFMKGSAKARPLGREGSQPLIPVYGLAFRGVEDFFRPSSELRELYPSHGFLPPVIDALYVNHAGPNVDGQGPVGGKALTLEEYNRLRAE